MFSEDSAAKSFLHDFSSACTHTDLSEKEYIF